jgi:outer membrane protein TolC
MLNDLMKNKFTLLCIGLGMIGGPLWAEDAPALDREATIRRALKTNPELLVAYAKLEKVKAESATAGLLANPELSIDYDQNTGSGDESESTLGFAYTQPLPLGKRRGAEKNLAEWNSRVSAFEVREKQLELIGEVDSLIVQLLAVRSQIDLREELYQLAEEWVTFAATQVGLISPLEVNQAKLDQQALRQGAEKLKAEAARLQLQVDVLVGGQDERLAIGGELTKPAELMKVSSLHAPGIDAARAQINRAAADRDKTKSEKWEDIGLQFRIESEESRDLPESQERENFFGIGITMALPMWKRNRAEVNVREKAVRIAEVQHDATMLQAKSKVRLLENEVQSLTRQLNLMQEGTNTTSARHLKETTEAYRQGQVDLFQLMRVQQQRLDLKSQHLDTLRDYHLAMSQYRVATASHPLYLEMYPTTPEEK